MSEEEPISHVWLNSLQDGDGLAGVYGFRNQSIRRASNGHHYLSAELHDRSGTLQLRIWRMPEEMPEALRGADVARISGKLERYRGVLQVVAENIEPLESAEADQEFIDLSPKVDVDAAWEEIRSILERVEDPELQRLRDAYFDDADYCEKLAQLPGSRAHHHLYPHGLLEHLRSMLSLGERVLEHYPWLDADLVRLGLFLHDSGKVDELDPAKSSKLSVSGSLLGHITLGIARLERVASGLENFPIARLRQLQHILLSHHESARLGSPKAPMLAEAQLIQALETLEAKMYVFHSAMSGEPEDQDAIGGVRYNALLKRQVYFPPSSGEEDESEAPEEE